MSRKALLKRKTKETDIEISLELDGNGKATIGIGRPVPDPYAGIAFQVLIIRHQAERDGR